VNRRGAQSGLSIIELMIASTLGLLGIAAVGGVYLSSSRNYKQDQSQALLGSELSYAMASITRDLEMAGFWAPARDPSVIQALATLSGSDCGTATTTGWTFQEFTAVAVDDNVDSATAHTNHPCLATADIQPGSDIVAVKRVHGTADGSDTATAGLVNGHVYLRTHFAQGALYNRGGTAPTLATPYQEWEYRPSVYFVQPYTVTATESPQVPSLCRMTLQTAAGATAPTWAKQCIAQGVENLQIEIGVDTDGDGATDYFVSNPSATEMSQAIAARIYLLARSANADPNYSDPRTYAIGNMAASLGTPSTTGVHYYRKTVSSEVVLRNPRSLRGLAYE